MNEVLRTIDRNRVVYCGDGVALARIRNGRCIYLDMRDAAVSSTIALGADYEPSVAATLLAVARKGDTFFDIGANVGYHTLVLADVLANGRHSMHLFEPNPVVFRCLRRTIHGNGMWTDVVLNQVALVPPVGHGPADCLRGSAEQCNAPDAGPARRVGPPLGHSVGRRGVILCPDALARRLLRRAWG